MMGKIDQVQAKYEAQLGMLKKYELKLIELRNSLEEMEAVMSQNQFDASYNDESFYLLKEVKATIDDEFKNWCLKKYDWFRWEKWCIDHITVSDFIEYLENKPIR